MLLLWYTKCKQVAWNRVLKNSLKIMLNKLKNVSKRVPKMEVKKVIFCYILRLCAQGWPRVGLRLFPETPQGSNLVPKGGQRTPNDAGRGSI